jgi:hypothetical protein
MRKRRDRKRRKKSPRSRSTTILPGRWRSTDIPLKDPGDGFAEVVMAALNAPDTPMVMRGQAAQMILFRPVAPDESCPCGSNRSFDNCHRDLHRMPILCHDIETETYSEIVAHETTFPVHDDEAARRSLKATPELCLTQEIPGRLFWQFLGQPPLQTAGGDMVFATVELNPGRLYFVTLSQRRNETITRTLSRRAGDALGPPTTREFEAESQYRRMLHKKSKSRRRTL